MVFYYLSVGDMREYPGGNKLSESVNIRQEMDNISDVVQTNTATAQQTAAATQELSTQARSLSDSIQKFTI